MGLIKPKKAGAVLPVLTNPASASEIKSGYEAINGEGKTMMGTWIPVQITESKTISTSGKISFEKTYFDVSKDITFEFPEGSIIDANTISFSVSDGWGSRFTYSTVSVNGNIVIGKFNYVPPSQASNSVYCMCTATCTYIK